MKDIIDLPENGVGSAGWWEGQINWAKEARAAKLPKWKDNIDSYLDQRTSDPGGSAPAVRVNIEFEKTEQKKSQLFFRVPEVVLEPLLPGLEQSVRVFQRVINNTIGPRGINVKPAVREMLFDILCPSGIGACKVGYEVYIDGDKLVQVGEEPDLEAMQPGAILGLNTPMKPIYEPAPNVVAERYFVDRISPAKLLIPPDFDGSDYGRAPWLGFEFWVDRAGATSKGWIVESDEVPDSEDDQRLVDLDRKNTSRNGQIRGREIWYYASRVDPTVAHPDKIRRIVFLEGKEDPVVHADSKYQEFMDGRFKRGMRSLPIKVVALRYVSDTPFPPSDCSATRRLADELSEGRTQMVKQRRHSLPLRACDKNRVDPDDVEKIKSGDIGGIYGVDGDPKDVIQEVARAAFPRENFTFDEVIHSDVDRMWALGSNQSAVREGSTRTATELTLIQRATDTRLAGEQSTVVDFFLQIVEAVGDLLQLFADDEEIVEIVDANGAKNMVPWNKETIQGRYAYSIKADSAKRPDMVYEREVGMARYNLLANDPFVNREQLVRDTVALFGGDPDRLVRPPTPPPPEKPRISVAIKGEDLDPFAPQYPNITGLLIQAGVPPILSPRPPAAGSTKAPKPVSGGKVDIPEPSGEGGDGMIGGMANASSDMQEM